MYFPTPRIQYEQSVLPSPLPNLATMPYAAQTAPGIAGTMPPQAEVLSPVQFHTPVPCRDIKPGHGHYLTQHSSEILVDNIGFFPPFHDVPLFST